MWRHYNAYEWENLKNDNVCFICKVSINFDFLTGNFVNITKLFINDD